MKAETLEKAQSLQTKINYCETELQELTGECNIVVDKLGGVKLITERAYYAKKMHDWFAQKINDALCEYRMALTATRDNLQTQLNEL